jgi:GTPase SAR1 family protein
MLEQNPSMKEIFPTANRVAMEPPTLEELIELFCTELRYVKLSLSPAATDKLCRLVTEAYNQGITKHWDSKSVSHYVNDIVKPAYCRHLIERLVDDPDGNACEQVQPGDIDESFFSNTQVTTEQLLDGFNEIVGLEEIKRNIITLSNRMRFYQQRRQLGLYTSDEAAFHAVFMGNPGTGKTTLIKHLINKYPDKNFVFLDGSLLINAQQTNLMSYFLENQDTVFILEDCEKVLTSLEDTINPVMPVLLNITDGIIGDVLGIKIICTFNTELSNIDSALLRKGRLSMKYEFKKLKAEKVNKILGKEINKDMTLADIYNYEDENDYSKDQSRKIGF